MDVNSQMCLLLSVSYIEDTQHPVFVDQLYRESFNAFQGDLTVWAKRFLLIIQTKSIGSF